MSLLISEILVGDGIAIIAVCLSFMDFSPKLRLVSVVRVSALCDRAVAFLPGFAGINRGLSN